MSATIVSAQQYKTPPIIGKVSLDNLPPECRSLSGTLCGSILMSSAPCRARGDRGCLLLKNPKYRLVDGRHP